MSKGDFIANVCAFSGSTLKISGLSLENIILVYSLIARLFLLHQKSL